MVDELTSVALPEGGHLFLAEIGEPSNNDLRVVVVLGRASETAVEAQVGPAFPVVSDDASRAFELIWWNYAAYAVRNESWAIPDEAQTTGTRRFGRKATSDFLAYATTSTWATDEHPGKLTHWYLNTEWHCLDVVSVEPPRLRELTMNEARAESAKLAARGAHFTYEAARSEVSDPIFATPWEGQYIGAAGDFAARCRELCDANPYGTDIPPPLNLIMGNLATWLWDDSFSQSEVRAALEHALQSLGPYAAGEERRGDRDGSP